MLDGMKKKESESNRKTLAAYQKHVADYVASTPAEVRPYVRDFIDGALALIQSGGDILEIGAAFGRDGVYMESKGFHVDYTDAAEGFVELMRQKGLSAERLDVLEDNISKQYDLVYANAVLLHFTDLETQRVLCKVKGALRLGGTFAFRTKQGEGAAWTTRKFNSPRYTRYWQPAPLRDAIEKAGYEIIELRDSIPDYSDQRWITVYTRPA